MIYDEAYWTNRYKQGAVQWDAGSITDPLKNYFDQLENKSIKILIPGCGNAYEAEYLWNKGFHNVYLADVSPIPLQKFKRKLPEFPERQLLLKDFFKLNGHFDLIVEQTFFCALHPSRREQYVQKVLELLKPEGKLMGVLFDDPLFDDHPPFGGNKGLYLPLFEPYFSVEVFENCYNSIKPRAGRELFLLLKKPENL
ncbi:MAG: methyltransferase domain-containing protein [Fulvivirga sp.]|nr:methyltransferase domain-containing protein [Fulvivirga sp.]